MRLGLGRVDLAGHDRAARLVLGNQDLAQAGARARRQPADVVRDLGERDRERLQRSVQQHERLVAGQRGELVGRASKRQTGERGDPPRATLAELRVGVEAGADRGAAERELVHGGQRRLDGGARDVDLRDPAGHFLADRERRRVLQVRPADLDDAGKRPRLGVERLAQPADRRQQAPDGFLGGRDVHRRRKRVVRRLALIHVIVRVHRLLAADDAAGELDRAIRDDLIRVHVRLRPAAGLPDEERKVIVQLALDHFVRRGGDRAGERARQQTEFGVRLGRGSLQEPERANQRPREVLDPDAEVVQRPLRLRAPVPVGRHGDVAKAVGFVSGVHVHTSGAATASAVKNSAAANPNRRATRRPGMVCTRML